MNINWRQKLASRKFWALVAAVATSIMVIIGAGEEVAVQITGLITTVGAVIMYILAEAHIDAQAMGQLKDSKPHDLNNISNKDNMTNGDGHDEA